MSIWAGLFLCLCYNLYFLFLLPEVNTAYLIYLDVLLGISGLSYGLAVGMKRKHRCEKKASCLQNPTLIYQEFPDMDDYEIAEHDVRVLQDQLKEQFDSNQDLQDYIAKWCHEVKIPLAASLLMAERIEDGRLRGQMQESLERINQQLKSALLGCKVQSSLFDIQIKSVSLSDCVRASIGNNQFFLIKNHFQLEIEVEDVFVYTDKNWLVYVLDQLISNAIKYTVRGSRHTCPDGEDGQSMAGDGTADRPLLKIWSEQKGLPSGKSDVLYGSDEEAFCGKSDVLYAGDKCFSETGEDVLGEKHIPYSDSRECFYRNTCMRLYIEDNGEGIKDSDIRRIFDKGYTGSNHHNGKYKSTGMGLYMVSKIMEKLGHQIFVESEEECYTRFWIDFYGDVV